MLYFGIFIFQNYLKWASDTYPISAGWIDIQPIRAGNKGAVSYLAKYLGKGLKKISIWVVLLGGKLEP